MLTAALGCLLFTLPLCMLFNAFYYRGDLWIILLYCLNVCTNLGPSRFCTWPFYSLRTPANTLYNSHTYFSQLIWLNTSQRSHREWCGMRWNPHWYSEWVNAHEPNVFYMRHFHKGICELFNTGISNDISNHHIPFNWSMQCQKHKMI